MNTLVLSILLGLSPPTPSTVPRGPRAVPLTGGPAVTLRVTSALGDQDDAQVREVVSARVAGTLEDEGFSIGEDSPRLLLIRVGRSKTVPTDYEVQISAAKNEEAAPKRVDIFGCSCSAQELLDKIDLRLARHLPAMFEDEPPKATTPPAIPEVDPAPAQTPPSSRPRRDKKPRPPHRDAPLFVGGLITTITVGGGLLGGSAIGFGIGAADDISQFSPAAYAAPAIGVAAVITGVVLMVVGKKRYNRAHLTGLAPLSGRF